MIHSCHRSNLGLINPLHHVDHSLRNILSNKTNLHVKQDEYRTFQKSNFWPCVYSLSNSVTALQRPRRMRHFTASLPGQKQQKHGLKSGGLLSTVHPFPLPPSNPVSASWSSKFVQKLRILLGRCYRALWTAISKFPRKWKVAQTEWWCCEVHEGTDSSLHDLLKLKTGIGAVAASARLPASASLAAVGIRNRLALAGGG